MMMQMLIAGGLPALVDDAREADTDNPRGYFELDAVKRTALDASWLRGARGKVVKVISFLLSSLPTDLEYRIVFVRRNLDHVVRSQAAMLARRGRDVRQSELQARATLAEHLVDVETWFEQARHVRALGVSYERVLAAPAAEVERIATFLGVPLDRDAMARAVEPTLCRQR